MRSVILMLVLTICVLGFGQQSPNTERSLDVTLTEWSIDMPRSLPAGTYVFKIKNQGDHAHTVKIKNGALEKKLPKELKAGESGELRVNLKPGVYEVTCPIGFGPIGHKAKGMVLELTVTAPIS